MNQLVYEWKTADGNEEMSIRQIFNCRKYLRWAVDLCYSIASHTHVAPLPKLLKVLFNCLTNTPAIFPYIKLNISVFQRKSNFFFLYQSGMGRRSTSCGWCVQWRSVRFLHLRLTRIQSIPPRFIHKYFGPVTNSLLCRSDQKSSQVIRDDQLSIKEKNFPFFYWNSNSSLVWSLKYATHSCCSRLFTYDT